MFVSLGYNFVQVGVLCTSEYCGGARDQSYLALHIGSDLVDDLKVFLYRIFYNLFINFLFSDSESDSDDAA